MIFATAGLVAVAGCTTAQAQSPPHASQTSPRPNAGVVNAVTPQPAYDAHPAIKIKGCPELAATIQWFGTQDFNVPVVQQLGLLKQLQDHLTGNERSATQPLLNGERAVVADLKNLTFLGDMSQVQGDVETLKLECQAS